MISRSYFGNDRIRVLPQDIHLAIKKVAIHKQVTTANLIEIRSIFDRVDDDSESHQVALLQELA